MPRTGSAKRFVERYMLAKIQFVFCAFNIRDISGGLRPERGFFRDANTASSQHLVNNMG